MVDAEDDGECPSYGHRTGKTPLPAYASEIIAAQLARRRADGSGTRGPFFADTVDTQVPATAKALTATIRLTCRRLGIDPFWLHRGSCRDGDSITTAPAPPTDWMRVRRLDVVFLDDYGTDR